jgi:hypothetical protein
VVTAFDHDAFAAELAGVLEHDVRAANGLKSAYACAARLAAPQILDHVEGHSGAAASS